MSKAFASNDSASEAPAIKADPKVYSVNEEAKIGRTAITYGTNEFKIQNDKGQIIDPSYTPIGKVLGDGQLVADGEVDGTITFEVSKDSTGLTFMFCHEEKAMLKFKVK